MLIGICVGPGKFCFILFHCIRGECPFVSLVFLFLFSNKIFFYQKKKRSNAVNLSNA